MNTNSGVRVYASKSDYLNRTPSKSAKAVAKGLSETVGDASKVEVSDEAKMKADSLKDELKKVPKKVEDKAKETAKASKHLASQAGSVLKKAIDSTPGLGSLPLPDIGGGEVESAAKSKEVAAKEPRLINKPGIFFIKGFSVNPFASDELGLTGMASNIPSSEVYNWDQEDDILESIKKRPHTQPILLIGHGMGGDTAVNLANTLNSVEHGFRRIDLMVTLDSIGFENDIIPQNVRENMNVISDQDIFFNDGPNIARNKNQTNVTNELRPETHSELDESPEVQFSVFEKINQVLNTAVLRKNIKDQVGTLYNIMNFNRR